MIFASDFTRHEHYTPIYTRKEPLENFVEKGGHVALAILNNTTIVGFSVLDYPDEKERWASLGGQIAMELKAVEVLRELRNNSLARLLLTHLFSDTQLEEKIVYLAAYSWTWDLAYSGLCVQSYRNMLICLYASFGFIEYTTNEPNICLKPENIFMVRMGKNVCQKIREKFKWLRFDILF
ncbi:MAG: N-acetyltransferase [Proteobacteria bacterium]|nr:N-acetyltransferase [Desulfobacula sp.]MBU4132179.1 N-acetyltransferase [Pseudomonadota bacterium]